MKKRTVALLMAAVLLFGAAVGGTMALLMQKTGSIINTFTAGKVAITLTEDNPTNKETIKMVPGEEIVKDPKITVEQGSETCYLFVKVEETNIDGYINYLVDDSVWASLDGVDGVYYKKETVDATSAAQEVYILKGNKVTVDPDVDAGMMAALNEDFKVQLKFTGYAVQSLGHATAAAAWTAAEFS